MAPSLGKHCDAPPGANAQPLGSRINSVGKSTCRADERPHSCRAMMKRLGVVRLFFTWRIMNTHALITATVLAFAPVLVGCSNEQPEATSSAPPVASAAAESSVPAPEPTLEEISIEQAGQQYLDLVRPLNDFLDAAPPSETWQEAAALDGQQVALMQDFVDQLVAATWPTGIQPYVDAVVADKTGDIAYYGARAQAKTEDEYNVAAASGEDVNDASQALRAHLGLASTV